MATQRPPRARQQGLSLLELAIVLGAIGVLGLLLSRGYDSSGDVRAQQRGRAEVEQASQALQAFMLAQHRLPCPDLNGNGREGDAGGACPAAARVGWLPSESLGLSVRGDGRLRYAVHRNAPNADLVAPANAGTETDSGNHVLRRALQAAAAADLVASEAFLTGDGAALGTVDCTSNRTANPAFVVVAPVGDRSGNGSAFDPPHAAAPGPCFAPPSLPPSFDYDDVVHAASAAALLGWLHARTR
jgi:type II secretory pathway pseudopilin PulG